jgi:hypothetical protein
VAGVLPQDGLVGVTTIAWDGKTLAVDSRMTGGCMVRSEEAKKLFALENGSYLAGCGEMQDVLLAVEWLNDGAKKDEKPTLGDEFAALIMDCGRCYRIEKKLLRWDVCAPFAAAGSGYEVALGAMAAGADAVRAVEIASRFDPGTNARVHYTDGKALSLNDSRARQDC